MIAGHAKGWTRHRLKFVSDINAATLPENTDPDWQFDYVDISRVTQGIITDDPQPTTFAQAPSRARRLATPGDTIVSTVRTYLRAVAQVVDGEDDQVFSTGFAVIHPRSGSVDPRFLSYYLQSTPFVERVVADSVGVSYPAINPSQIGAYDLRLPGVPVQRAIADFLDRETAQIDAMIEAQRGLVSLLNERRRQTITQAVTSGLDGSPLRPSDVDWIGPIPIHWEVKAWKQVGRAIIGLTYAPEDVVEEGEGALVLRAGNIQNGMLDYEDCVYVDVRVPVAKRCRDGDLLICSRNGSARLIGKSALVTGDAVGETWGAFMSVFRSDVNDYLYWVMQSDLLSRQLGLFSTSTINQLTTGMLHNMRVPLPPREEQVRIIEYLRLTLSHVESLVAEAERTVTLLRERREALITAAVTGRIDPTTGIERVEEAS